MTRSSTEAPELVPAMFSVSTTPGATSQVSVAGRTGASSNDRHVVLITGVSSGIGEAIAEDLLGRGYHVFGSVRRPGDAAELQRKWPDAFQPLVFDVTDAAAIALAVEQVQEILGGRTLKALINNAGINLGGPLMHQPLAEVRRVFEVNVFGLLAVTQAFLPSLGAWRGRVGPAGRVVNIGSVSGAITVPFLCAYSGSKHAVEALSQGLRRELSLYGVEVVTIEPGMVRSRLGEKRVAEKAEERYAQTDYLPWLEQFDRSIQAQEKAAPPADKVTAAVRHAIESPKPRTRYPLDRIWMIGRIIPDRAFDGLIFKALGLQRK
jgi:NAD(P)-dependent dehydrogenase (short-subunit alcohol dehydrogenase family)